MVRFTYAFWEHPDWAGGDNLRDPGTEPFWMIDPRSAQAHQPHFHAVQVIGSIAHDSADAGNPVWIGGVCNGTTWDRARNWDASNPPMGALVLRGKDSDAL